VESTEQPKPITNKISLKTGEDFVVMGVVVFMVVLVVVVFLVVLVLLGVVVVESLSNLTTMTTC
jgi:hypothetical protein